VTMAPSPWRRRKKIRPWVLLNKTTNALIVLGFAALVIFACWEAQSREAQRKPPVYRARVRPGGSDTPLPPEPDPHQQ